MSDQTDQTRALIEQMRTVIELASSGRPGRCDDSDAGNITAFWVRQATRWADQLAALLPLSERPALRDNGRPNTPHEYQDDPETGHCVICGWAERAEWGWHLDPDTLLLSERRSHEEDEADLHALISDFYAVTDPEAHADLAARAQAVLGMESADGTCGNPICHERALAAPADAPPSPQERRSRMDVEDRYVLAGFDAVGAAPPSLATQPEKP